MYIFKCDDLQAVLDQWQRIVQQHTPQGSFELSPELFDCLQEINRVKWFFYTDNANGIAIRLYDTPFREAYRGCFCDRNRDPWVILRGHNLGLPDQSCKRQMRAVLGQNMWSASESPTGQQLSHLISLVRCGEEGRLEYFQDNFHNHATPDHKTPDGSVVQPVQVDTDELDTVDCGPDESEKPIELRGYSERGMVNALFYEMNYSTNGLKLLERFLSLCAFPFAEPDFSNLEKAQIIIEQSFSDFGDLDVLLLLDSKVGKQSVFIEAKVKTCQANFWSINDQWNGFLQMLRDRRINSNLFIQLYRKMRLIKKARTNANFQADSVSARWSLGDNTVVKAAFECLIPYCDNTWLVALIPDSPDAVTTFFAQTLGQYTPGRSTDLPDWDVKHWGHITWDLLEQKCRQNSGDWRHTLNNFKYNSGQIFRPLARHEPILPPIDADIVHIPDSTANTNLFPGNVGRNNEQGWPPQPGTHVVWNSPTGPKPAIIKNRGPQNTRIILENGESIKVPNGKITQG